MNVRVIKAIFFILIFLTSKVGLALNVHYCGDHIAEISVVWNVDGCGMSSEKSHDKHQDSKVKKNHCCHDELIYIQNNEPQKTTDLEFQVALFAVPHSNFYFSIDSKTHSPKAVSVKPLLVLPKRKIFLLYHSLVFYS